MSINVVRALLNSLACTTIFANGCLCVDKKFLSNFGCSVFSVRSYLIFNLSNAFATLTAAQISTSTPVSFFICDKSFVSFFCKSFFILSAFSKSTRTPFVFMSRRQGKSRVSRSKIPVNSCLRSSTLKNCHRRNVKSASCSAYGPTYIAGNLYISAFGSTPHSLAASYNKASDFVSLR